eukprot:5512889-Prymnesium_polylepis.3
MTVNTDRHVVCFAFGTPFLTWGRSYVAGWDHETKDRVCEETAERAAYTRGASSATHRHD